VPGAFEIDDREDLPETLEAPKPTETDETVEIISETETTEAIVCEMAEMDETVRSEDDPDRQLQGELSFKMSEESEIPAYTAVTP
jgi:hypothetical protein